MATKKWIHPVENNETELHHNPTHSENSANDLSAHGPRDLRPAPLESNPLNASHPDYQASFQVDIPPSSYSHLISDTFQELSPAETHSLFHNFMLQLLERQPT